MDRITADFIYSPGFLLREHYLEVEEDGTIVALRPLDGTEKRLIRYEGVLFPGFVNAHCHLELSAFRGKLKTGLGMTAFAQAIVQERKTISEEAHQYAIYDALREAFFTGTVAIGDICNTDITAAAKKDFSKLFTHSFIELIGLDATKAEGIVEKGEALVLAFEEGKSSLCLHAPYSVSAELRDRVYDKSPFLTSVHLLESQAERDLFERGEGDFIPFYEAIQVPLPQFSQAFSHQHILENLPKDIPILFVHCLEARREEIELLGTTFPQAYFCLCPKSNVYIHDKMPDLSRFESVKDRICLGTDSLASNSSLRMIEEIQLLAKHYPELELHTLLKWGTTQGAMALGKGKDFGAFAPESKPGVNLLEGIDQESLALGADAKVSKLY
jgi:cytosine/adenosine deaminase-related metal-dependent hydrolase